MAKQKPSWFGNLFGKKPGQIAPDAGPNPQETGGGLLERAVPQPGTLPAAEQSNASSPIRNAEVPYAPKPKVPLEWSVGDAVLDLYEVKCIHDGGGMGLVYRVRHRGWNMDLAVKSPRADYFRTEAQKENFSRECETWVNLGLHPHIVSCHYVRNLGGVPRVFAEYVEGGSLKDWIDDRRLYKGGTQEILKRILDIAIQFAWGLHYAHEKSLIHQDVKPANVLMTPDGSAKITDFGLAKARAATGELVAADASRSVLVSAGGMTPAFCSPEQANKKPLSRKTDIWSWAVSVLEMFVGGVCWQNGIAAPHVLNQLNEVRVEGVLIPEPPPALIKLLEQCLATEPDGRPENFRIIADSLKSIYHTHAGEKYARQFPEAANLLADAFNNHAVSMLDLGRSAEAQKLFSEALAVDPTHAETNFNSQLLLWRAGRITDASAIDSLTNLFQVDSGADLEKPV